VLHIYIYIYIYDISSLRVNELTNTAYKPVCSLICASQLNYHEFNTAYTFCDLFSAREVDTTGALELSARRCNVQTGFRKETERLAL